MFANKMLMAASTALLLAHAPMAHAEDTSPNVTDECINGEIQWQSNMWLYQSSPAVTRNAGESFIIDENTMTGARNICENQTRIPSTLFREQFSGALLVKYIGGEKPFAIFPAKEYATVAALTPAI